MKDLYQLSPGDLVVWIIPRTHLEPPLEWVAAYALRGPVGVLDGGDRFEVRALVRLLRRRTHQLTETLSRIRATRVTTGHQLIRILEETPASAIPHIGLDFLAPFYEESISTPESFYLLASAVGHLHRLRKYAPVVLCIHPPEIEQPGREKLAEVLLGLADEVFIADALPPHTRLL
ncbi:MAG TPA: hypothetical protein PK530_02200 [Anaerolineales bacterium]|nr:hypothetical protein [Anaerolineales bacterium]